MLSSLVPVFKGKVDPFNPNSYRGIKPYRGIKLLEHTGTVRRFEWAFA